MYPNIAFIDHGQIVVGYIELVGAVAIATEGRQTIAKLRRRKDETFKQLLDCLDTAIASATIEEVYVDEVNVPQQLTHTTSDCRVHLNQSWTHTLLSHAKPTLRPDGPYRVTPAGYVDGASDSQFRPPPRRRPA